MKVIYSDRVSNWVGGALAVTGGLALILGFCAQLGHWVNYRCPAQNLDQHLKLAGRVSCMAGGGATILAALLLLGCRRQHQSDNPLTVHVEESKRVELTAKEGPMSSRRQQQSDNPSLDTAATDNPLTEHDAQPKSALKNGISFKEAQPEPSWKDNRASELRREAVSRFVPNPQSTPNGKRVSLIPSMVEKPPTGSRNRAREEQRELLQSRIPKLDSAAKVPTKLALRCKGSRIPVRTEKVPQRKSTARSLF